MKHLRYYRLHEEVDLSRVDIEDEGDTGYAKYVIKQVEQGSGQRVTSISGFVEESDFSLNLNLEDGQYVEVSYQYSPYPTATKGFILVELSNGTGTYRVKDTDREVRDLVEAGEEIGVMLRFLIRRANPEYSLHYYEMADDLGIAQLALTFKSREAAEAWIESLYDHIKEADIK